VQDIVQNKLAKIFISTDYKQIIGQDSAITKDPISQYNIADVNPIEVPVIVSKAFEHNVVVKFVDFAQSNFLGFVLKDFMIMAANLFPLLVLAWIAQGFFSMFSGGGNGGGGGAGGLIPRTRIGKTTEMFSPNVSLNSWAGSPEVLEECREVVSYLDSELRDAYNATGAEMPRGILLEGPPGTGKTLLAKGIATETKSNFITVSGAEFVELYVGMGAARVRELFRNARENKPCVIFIDEIDAVGKQRGSNPGSQMGSNDEREQTLNQILFEMDGFNDNDGLLVLAATNRKDILDNALLRPGRFDRVIQVPLPDRYSRGKILEFYFRQKPLEPRVVKDLRDGIAEITGGLAEITLGLAEITDGFSGAELKNLVNEAAILAARQNRTVITEKDLYDAFEKSIVGLIRTNADAHTGLITKLRVAIHESGHALMALRYPEYFDVQKVSIQATYSGAGGYTIFTENPEIKEGGLYTRDILKKRLAVMLGGKAAEQVYYGDDFVSVGAVQDLKQANQLAQKMVGNFGMGVGELMEVFYNENVQDVGFGFSGARYSENTKFDFDRETMSLIAEAYRESKLVLAENKDVLVDFSELLMKNTVLGKADIREAYRSYSKIK
jgi:cell division protease FtsH